MFTEMMGYNVEHLALLETTAGPYIMAVGEAKENTWKVLALCSSKF